MYITESHLLKHGLNISIHTPHCLNYKVIYNVHFIHIFNNLLKNITANSLKTIYYMSH